MTKFVEWTKDLSVGIEEIDEQHKVLVDLVNIMHEAIHQRHGSELVRETLGKLADYTRIHFAVEESLMRILHYPDYEAHKAQHETLLQHVVELTEKVDSGRTAIGFELMHFLKVWLTKHIMESDKHYGYHFLSSGINPTLQKKSWVSRMWDHLR